MPVRPGSSGSRVQCIKKRRPYQLIDASEIAEGRTAEIVACFIERHGIETLNLAGPSGHKVPKSAGYAWAVIGELLQLTGW